MSDKLFEIFADSDVVVEPSKGSEESSDSLATGGSDVTRSNSDNASNTHSFHTRKKSSIGNLTTDEEGSLTPALGSGFSSKSSAFAPISRGQHSRMHSLDAPVSSYQLLDTQRSSGMQDLGPWQLVNQQWNKLGELQGPPSQQEIQAGLEMNGPTQTLSDHFASQAQPHFRGVGEIEFQGRHNAMHELPRREQEHGQNMTEKCPEDLTTEKNNSQSTYNSLYGPNLVPSLGRSLSVGTLHTMPSRPIGFTSLITGSAGGFSAPTGANNHLQPCMQNFHNRVPSSTMGKLAGPQWVNQSKPPAGQTLGETTEPSTSFMRPAGKTAESGQSLRPRDSVQPGTLNSIEELLGTTFASSTVKQEADGGELATNAFTNAGYGWFNPRLQNDVSNGRVDNVGEYDSSGNPTDPFQGAAESVFRLSPQTESLHVQFLARPGPPTTQPEFHGAPTLQVSFENDITGLAQTTIRSSQRSLSDFGVQDLALSVSHAESEAQGTLQSTDFTYTPSVVPVTSDQRITGLPTAGIEAKTATESFLGQVSHSRSRGGKGSRGAYRPRGGARGSSNPKFRSTSQTSTYEKLNMHPRSAIHPRSNSKSLQVSSKRSPRKQTYRRRQSQRNLDSIDGDGTDPRQTLRIPLEIPGLTSPHLTTGPSQLLNPPRGIFWSLTRNFSMPVPPVDNRRTGELSQIVNPLMDIHFEIPYEPNGDISTVPIRLCQPPLFDHLPPYPKSLDPDALPRARKQSKYTQKQDQTILELKAKGHNWADIARAADCQNQLAARNRYQVLIGQQGGAAFFWTADDCAVLQSLLDEAERAKWLYIAEELTKKLNRKITIAMVHFRMAHIFCEDPLRFGIVHRQSRQKGAPPLQRLILDREARDELIRRARERSGRKT